VQVVIGKYDVTHDACDPWKKVTHWPMTYWPIACSAIRLYDYMIGQRTSTLPNFSF